MKWSSVFLLAVICFSFVSSKVSKKQYRKTRPSHLNNLVGVGGFEGCPYENDFYYTGVITSPYYPNKYPNNGHCYYYLNAEYGSVLRFNFTNFDLETCCDYVIIYDGPTETSAILAQFGGKNMTAPKPTGLLHSSTRYALMEFITDAVVQYPGFRLEYDSVSTASPCNRDIVLVINGLSSVGTQANFVKQLQFIANNLVSTWNVGQDKVRVGISLQTDENYAIVYDTDQFDDTKTLQQTILGLTNDVTDVTQNNGTDFECLFRYGFDDLQAGFTLRSGISTVEIVFVAQNPANNQDYYEALDFAHDLRDQSDAKVITIAMGSGIDVSKVGRLSYGQGFYFGADYDQLTTLASSINKAICQSELTQCGP